MFLYNKLDGTIPLGNLISYLRLNNDIVDQTGNLTYSKTGTIFSNGIFSGASNESIDFANLSDRLTTPDNSLLDFSNKPFSVSFCINLTNIAVIQSTYGQRYLVSKRGETSNLEWQVDIRDTGKLLFRLYDNTNGVFIQAVGGTVLTNSTPYHITCTFNGKSMASGIKLYVNGVLETMTLTTSGVFVSVKNGTEKLSIGGVDWSSGNSFSPLGKFDGIGIWDTKLNHRQVKNIYNKQASGLELL